MDQLEVRVNGVRAGLLYISATQINFLVPSSAAPTSGQPLARIDVIYRGRIIATQDNLVIRRTEPAFYSSNGFALGQHYSDATPASLTDVPIARRSGNILVLYGTGFRRAPSLAALLNDVPLDVLYAGPAPGFAGLDQLNLRLTPAAVATLADGAIANLVLVTPESASPPVRLQFD